jgi:membrane protease YdiL (CAAX protease family)
MSSDSGPPPTIDAPRKPTLQTVPWRASDLIVGIAPLLALRVGPLLFGPDWLARIPQWFLWCVLIVGLAWMFAFPIWTARRRAGWLPRGQRHRAIVIDIALPIVVLPAFWLIEIGAYVVWQHLAGPEAVPQNPLQRAVRSTSNFDLFLIVVVVVVVGPIGEELLFRGMVYNCLRQWLPLVIAAPLQGIAFGFIHPYGTAHAIGASILGCALALLYEWRKSLLAPILVHAGHNLAALILVALTVSASPPPPVLGINGEPAEGGCRLTRVWPGSAADEAGLRVGDVLTTIDGHSVDSIESVRWVVRSKNAGDSVTINAVRDGQPFQVEAILKAQQSP